MNADTMPNTRNRQLKSPMLLPVINGEKPPIPVPLRRRFDTPYRYVDSNVLLSCSFDNLLTMSQYSYFKFDKQWRFSVKKRVLR